MFPILHRKEKAMAQRVKIDGEVKQISAGHKFDADGDPKLVARLLIEFAPIGKEIAWLQNLIALHLQGLNVHATITVKQIGLPPVKAK